MELLVAGNLGNKPIRKGVHTLSTHSVEATRIFVSALTKLTTGVKTRQNKFNSRNPKLRVHIDRNSSTIVGNAT